MFLRRAENEFAKVTEFSLIFSKKKTQKNPNKKDIKKKSKIRSNSKLI